MLALTALVKPIVLELKKQRKEDYLFFPFFFPFLCLFFLEGASLKKKMSPGVLFTAFALSLFLSMSLKNLQAHVSSLSSSSTIEGTQLGAPHC